MEELDGVIFMVFLGQALPCHYKVKGIY